MARPSRPLEERIRARPFSRNTLGTGDYTQGVNDPETLQRQFDAFELRGAGASLRDIGTAIGRGPIGVLADLAAETARREAAMAGTRDSKVALTVSRYENVILRALNRLAANDAYREWRMEMTGKPLPPNPNAFLEEKIIIEANERIERTLGLHRGVIGEDTSAPARGDTNINIVLDTFAELPAEARLELLQMVRMKIMEQKMKNVTPPEEIAS